MVIFHSYVSLPEGIIVKVGQEATINHQGLQSAQRSQSWSEDTATSLELQNQVARLELLHGFGEACLMPLGWFHGKSSGNHPEYGFPLDLLTIGWSTGVQPWGFWGLISGLGLSRGCYISIQVVWHAGNHPAWRAFCGCPSRWPGGFHKIPRTIELVIPNIIPLVRLIPLII